MFPVKTNYRQYIYIYQKSTIGMYFSIKQLDLIVMCEEVKIWNVLPVPAPSSIAVTPWNWVDELIASRRKSPSSSAPFHIYEEA